MQSHAEKVMIKETSDIEIIPKPLSKNTISDWFQDYGVLLYNFEMTGYENPYTLNDDYQGQIFGAEFQKGKYSPQLIGKFVFIESKVSPDKRTIMFSYISMLDDWNDERYLEWLDSIKPKVIDEAQQENAKVVDEEKPQNTNLNFNFDFDKIKDLGFEGDEIEDYRLVVDVDNEKVDSELLISASNGQGKSFKEKVGTEDFDTLYFFYDDGAPNEITLCAIYDEFGLGHCEDFKTSGTNDRIKIKSSAN
ncbi:MAG: hypothetical protein ACPKPY_06030 [Nitrososphaeraceae archaeon]